VVLKNPVEKATEWLCPKPQFSLPNVESFTVCKGATCKPAIVFRTIVGPMDEVLPAFSMPTFLDYFLDKIPLRPSGVTIGCGCDNSWDGKGEMSFRRWDRCLGSSVI
jgi:hypothetical protein